MTPTLPLSVPRPLRRSLTTAQQDLARQYLPLARSLARPLKDRFPGARDDLDSAACLALVEAAGGFDPGRNVKFATYARHRILGALLDVRRRLVTKRSWRGHPGHASCFARLVRDGERHGRVLFTDDDPPVGAELERHEEVEALLRKLPPRHAAACRQLYLHGRNQTEAAARIGCSQSRLSVLRREALAMLGGNRPDTSPTPA